MTLLYVKNSATREKYDKIADGKKTASFGRTQKNNYICAHKSDLLRKWKTLTGNYLNQRRKG